MDDPPSQGTAASVAAVAQAPADNIAQSQPTTDAAAQSSVDDSWCRGRSFIGLRSGRTNDGTEQTAFEETFKLDCYTDGAMRYEHKYRLTYSSHSDITPAIKAIIGVDIWRTGAQGEWLFVPSDTGGTLQLSGFAWTHPPWAAPPQKLTAKDRRNFDLQLDKLELEAVNDGNESAADGWFGSKKIRWSQEAAPPPPERPVVERITIPTSTKAIADRAYEGREMLESITFLMPASLKTIGRFAFSESGLTSATLPPSLVEIREGAFEGCEKLTALTIPDSVAKIGPGAFCETALTELVLPSSLTQLAPRTFRRCRRLTSVALPTSITRIGSEAFACSSVAALTLPSALKSLEDEAFASSDLQAVTLPPLLTAIPTGSFLNCASLATADIPPSVKSIGDRAFEGCSSLIALTLPSSLSAIPKAAFKKSQLKAFTIPASVKSIGGFAFAQCALESISVPPSVVSVDEYAFTDCKQLTSVTIHSATTQLGKGVFSRCPALTSVTLPAELNGRHHAAFPGYTGQVTVL